MAKDKLVTSGYCLILAANFLLYFAFYLILPVLPFYLTEVFHTGNAAVGVIFSCYTIASLCIRPLSTCFPENMRDTAMPTAIKVKNNPEFKVIPISLAYMAT